MRVTDEMVDAAIAADSHASWWAGNSREGAEKRMRAALEAALAVEGTEAKPVAWRWRYKNTEWVYLEERPTWFEDEAGNERFESEPLYTTPPAGIREALINLNAELDAMWNTPADQRVQDGQINSVLVQNITNAQIACVAALRGSHERAALGDGSRLCPRKIL